MSMSKTEKQKQERLGEVGYNKSGDRMIIIEYYNSANITVQFDNGFKVFKVRYTHFKDKSILNPSKKSQGREGEINYNRYGSKMTIIKYINVRNIIVQFDNGYIVNAQYINFKDGSISNPYDKTLFNIGYLGEGKYEPTANNRNNLQYDKWRSMLKRCYDSIELKKSPTYEDCSVCEEWHNFQNFAKWFDNNYYQIEDETMCLDKDILHKGNKIYSPENCILVPNNINVLFTKRQNYRGLYPIGVALNGKTNKYIAHCNNGIGENIYLGGTYNTPEEAFQVYKNYKEKIIKQIADEYKDKIPPKLYEAMYSYKVEITD